VTTILAAEGVSGIAQDLGALFEFDALLFSGTPFALNRTGILYLLSALIIIVLMVRVLGRGAVVPGRAQLAVENIMLFVRDNIARDVIGPQGARYAPMLTAMFFFIWVNNLYEVTPFVNFPTTSRMAVPAMLAIFSWVVYVLAGVAQHGLVRYFVNMVKPSGVPAFVLPLIIPIEFVSNFIVRPLTLAVRLFANMMAGHIILAIIFVSANTFLVKVAGESGLEFAPGGPVGAVLGIFLAFAAGPMMVLFEIVVGTIQAYIFTILTAVYIQTSLSHH
jgi:F-type H+-transporting ATPase subunit a